MANLVIREIEFVPEDPRRTFKSILRGFLFDDDDDEMRQVSRGIISSLVKHYVQDWEARNFEVNIPPNLLYSEAGLSECNRGLFARIFDPFQAAEMAMNNQPEARRTQELDIAEMKYAVHRWGTFI
jgi:hypothetical protein